jgi:hypothetical protein
VVSISFEEIEDDQGLPADSAVTPHLLVQSVAAQSETFGGLRVGQSERFDPVAQFVTRDENSLRHGISSVFLSYTCIEREQWYLGLEEYGNGVS